MKLLALILVLAAAAAPARAERISYYRAGAALVGPGSLESPGSYEVGYGFNAGVSVPFKHRLAVTLDLAFDGLPWKSGSESVADHVVTEREDFSIGSALLGLDVAFRRGSGIRPLFSAGLGMARVAPGAADVIGFGGVTTREEPEVETVFAFAAAAGVRMRLPWSHTAARLQLGWLGLGRDEFQGVVPLRLQLEF
jgi:opacity protein-like surface antigen